MSDIEKIDKLLHTVSDFNQSLSQMETFIRRRFDEISMEINATAQQMDMSDGDIKGHFSEIIQTMQTIAFQGTGSTAVNTGVELEAVVKVTEEAANKILDATEAATQALAAPIDWNDQTARQKVVDTVNARLQDILMACSFQDLTGQRVRKTLANLRDVETKLTTTLDKMGIAPPPAANTDNSDLLKAGASQSDIDALFGD